MNFQGSLARYLLENVTGDIYSRGLDYAMEGRIHDFVEEPKKIKAIVSGSKNYLVEIREGQIYFKGYCDCPYVDSNDDYCKHVLALAVYYDNLRKVPLPSGEEVEGRCLEVDYSFGPRINAMFNDSLHADLDLLATASDNGSWVRQHTKIELKSHVADNEKPISIKEVNSGFGKIISYEKRYNYDSYFCAGEVSAVLSMTLDAILHRLKDSPREELTAVFKDSVIFYYNNYLQMIDGSDGVWQIPRARIIEIFGLMKSKLSENELEDVREELNEKIEGWGDIFDDLGVE